MLSRLIRRIIPASFQVIKTSSTNNSRLCYQVPFSHLAPGSPAVDLYTCRTYSQQANPEVMTVNYDHVKKATTNNSILIIDVREPDEIKEHGKIPNSINIPLGNVTPVLKGMPDKEFQQIYSRPKPVEDTEIIFYCMIGKRSGMAQQSAINLGYKNTKNYLGSWTDWANKIQ